MSDFIGLFLFKNLKIKSCHYNKNCSMETKHQRLTNKNISEEPKIKFEALSEDLMDEER